MDIKAEILDYINCNEPVGALLLTGKWGCGKSYLVKKIAEELNKSKKAAVSVISLFGLDSVASINERVKDEYIGFKLGSLGKAAKKLSKGFTTVAKDGLAVASIAAEGSPGLSAASHGLSALMSYDVFGFIEVRNTIGKEENTRSFVLVFDDLERNRLCKKDLLGTLNEYVENKNIKVIIVADEEKISDEEYKEYKEKLIFRTIKLKTNYNEIIDDIVENYRENSKDYKNFLKDNTSLLKQLFFESESDNIRTIKCIITDFERFYDTWEKAEIKNDKMNWALYTFGADVYVSKNPKKYEDSRKIKEMTIFSQSPKEKHFTDLRKNGNNFYSFKNWIENGVWEKEVFLSELHQKYCKVEHTPCERFIRYSFWSLQQSDIDEGFPEALKKAYNGELSIDDLLYFLKKIHVLKENNVTLPVEVDYKRVESGLDSHIEKIKNGLIKKQNNYDFAFNNELDPDAIPINEKIKKIESIVDSWEVRKKFIQLLNGEQSLSTFEIKNACIDKFDDELFETFCRRYSISTNALKREYAIVLLSIVFDNDSYSNDEDIECSIKNFERLLDCMNNQKSDDEITRIINQNFVIHIQQLSIMQRKKE